MRIVLIGVSLPAKLAITMPCEARGNERGGSFEQMKFRQTAGFERTKVTAEK